jgi:hypothetical protein
MSDNVAEIRTWCISNAGLQIVGLYSLLGAVELLKQGESVFKGILVYVVRKWLLLLFPH